MKSSIIVKYSEKTLIFSISSNKEINVFDIVRIINQNSNDIRRDNYENFISNVKSEYNIDIEILPIFAEVTL